MLEYHAKNILEGKTNDNNSDESFYAMENAKIVREAEKYYRHMFEGGEITWNIRDTHMCDCLQDLLEHNGPETKAVIWVIKFNDFSMKINIYFRHIIHILVMLVKLIQDVHEKLILVN
jgi:hypothetical protein